MGGVEDERSAMIGGTCRKGGNKGKGGKNGKSGEVRGPLARAHHYSASAASSASSPITAHAAEQGDWQRGGTHREHRPAIVGRSSSRCTRRCPVPAGRPEGRPPVADRRDRSSGEPAGSGGPR